MGLIKAMMHSIGGSFADQWLEYIRAGRMDNKTVMAPGVKVRGKEKRNTNTRGSAEFISDGSLIEVGVNQFMILTDGGRIVDFSAEPGYYRVSNEKAPSMFSGPFSNLVQESFERFRFGGVPSSSQRVYFINLQEIQEIAFGTPNPINYFDNFYNAELYLRTNGYFSVKITDPIRFYAEAIPKNQDYVTIQDLQKLYISEFLTAFQTAVNKMSVDGIRISHVASKAMELAQYMGEVLDESWNEKRGMKIESVGINSISYDESSKQLIELRNKGAMLSDPTIREGYIQGAAARGLEAAGANSSGASAGFFNMNLGTQQAGSFLSAAGQNNREQAQKMQQQSAQEGWTCSCGAKNSGKFCMECGKPKPTKEEWTCECGAKNSGKFCTECGKPRPVRAYCPNCGKPTDSGAKFCPECGTKLG